MAVALYVPTKSSASGTNVKKTTSEDVDRLTDALSSLHSGPIAPKSPYASIVASKKPSSLYTWTHGNSAIKGFGVCLNTPIAHVDGVPAVLRGASDDAWHVPKHLAEALLTNMLPDYATLSVKGRASLEQLADAIGTNVWHMLTYMLLVAEPKPVGTRKVSTNVIDQLAMEYIDPEVRQDLDADGKVQHMVFTLIDPVMPRKAPKVKAPKAPLTSKHIKPVKAEEDDE